LKESTIIESIEPRLYQVDTLNQTAYKGYVPALTRDGPKTQTEAERGQDYIADNDLFRLLILGFTDAFVLLALGVGIVSAIISRGTPSMAAAFLGFFSIFMTWFNLALHLPISVVVADLCYDSLNYGIEARLIDRDNSLGNNYGVLSEIATCASWVNSNSTFYWIDELKTEAIQQQEQMRNSSNFNTTAYNQLQANIDILESAQLDTLYVRQCRWMIPALSPLQTTDICSQKLEGVVIVWATSFVVGVLMIPFTVLSIMGYKRFPKQLDDGFF